MKHGFLIVVVTLLSVSAWAGEVYLSSKDFVSQAFGGTPPEPQAVWLTGNLGKQAAAVLQHPLRTVRVRYWLAGERTAWVLEEIGKERPITAGFVVDNGAIEQARVLAFRESRGWEIRHAFFTDQFHGAALAGERLDRSIDGISGATLSVRAMKRMARLALLLDDAVRRR